MAMGLFQILKEAFTAVPTFDDLNDEFYDGLEEALILADVGADTAADTVAQLRKRVKERFIGRMDEVKDALRDILKSKLEVGDSALVLEGKPAVVLVIGHGYEFSERNIIATVDRMELGEPHMYSDWVDGVLMKFDPDGLLSTLSSVAHVLIGFMAGRMLMSESDNRRHIYIKI